MPLKPGLTALETGMLRDAYAQPLDATRHGKLLIAALARQADGIAEEARKRNHAVSDALAAACEVRAANLRAILGRWPETVVEHEAKPK